MISFLAAASETADDTWIKALIAAGGVVAGALFTAAAAAYTARQKIKESELTYAQKLQDGYLANARLYIEGVYAPLSIALTKLSNAYRSFRGRINFDPPDVDDKAAATFREACHEYNRTMSDLLDRGADAFLTTALDERIQSFNGFIRESLKASEPVIKFVVGYSLSFAGLSFLTTSYDFTSQVRGRWATRAARLGDVSFKILGSGFKYRVNELLAAPVFSKEFESRISTDIPAIKFLIKEVTLGTQSNVK